MQRFKEYGEFWGALEGAAPARRRTRSQRDTARLVPLGGPVGTRIEHQSRGQLIQLIGQVYGRMLPIQGVSIRIAPRGGIDCIVRPGLSFR